MSTVVVKIEFLVCVNDAEIKETCKERLVNLVPVWVQLPVESTGAHIKY
jgi:hypothetical protein